MDRSQVRAEFERRFTAERMAGAYLTAYRLLLAQSQAARAPLIKLARPASAVTELLPTTRLVDLT
jgi:hypothetical protein